MRTYLYFILVLAMFISGCIPTENMGSENQEPFASQIFKDYPELLDREYEITVIKRIVDGDTFVTSSGQKVRMIGVNTPEVFGEAEYYGQEASNFSKQQLVGQTVYLFKDVSDTDKYDRWLRFVFIKEDPIMFNETLIMEGYANTMSLSPDVLLTKKFSLLKREAQDDRIGLWSTADSADSLSCDDPKIKGNINSRNEKIFHIPGGEQYNATNAEVMFCTNEEAKDSGFRQAGR
jgi:micrococcal nuclease